MCSQYWTIKKANITCPKCKQSGIWEDLQTHFMGQVGSCMNFYDLGESVPELSGVKEAEIKPPQEHFMGICPSCDAFVECGAYIKNEKVVEIFPVEIIVS